MEEKVRRRDEPNRETFLSGRNFADTDSLPG